MRNISGRGLTDQELLLAIRTRNAKTPKRIRIKEACVCHPEREHSALGLCRSCYIEKRRKANPRQTRIKDRRSSWRRALKQYGITQDQYDAMLFSAQGICAACKLPFGKQKIHTDHNHKTGKVRGIIHAKCNVMLGMANDCPETLRNAADYLENNC